MLILTVGDTPSTDDQVFVCQLGSVIEVRFGARITISYFLRFFTDTGVIGIGGTRSIRVLLRDGGLLA